MRIGQLVLLCFPWIGYCAGQTPSGVIAGVVHDPSGGDVTGAKVKLLGASTGLERTMSTSEQGDYSFAALLPGEYAISVEASGFEGVTRQAIVEAGTTTAADFTLTFGNVKQSVEVNATVTPQIQFDTHTVGGVITNAQIQGLPLNGRNFLELAKLEPGVRPPSPTNNSRVFVPILGAPGGWVLCETRSGRCYFDISTFRWHEVIDLATGARHKHKPDDGEVNSKETHGGDLGPQRGRGKVKHGGAGEHGVFSSSSGQRKDVRMQWHGCLAALPAHCGRRVASSDFIPQKGLRVSPGCFW